MNGYRETFRKHRILFCLPPLLVALALGVLAFGAGKNYQSYASLWIDNGPLAGSSLDSNSGSQPSGAEQTLLTELLATQNFDLDVANGSALKKYVSAQGGTSQQIAANLATAVKNGTSSTAPGPQVLELSFTGPSSAIAESSLRSLISHLQGSMTQYGQAFGQTAQAYYQSQVDAATKAVAKANAATAAFASSHPGATSSNRQYAALLAAQQSATGQLASATTQLNQAIGQSTGAGTSTLVRVIDPPSVPTTPTSGKKKAAMEIVGGLVGGMLISFLIIAAMTPSRGRDDSWDAELGGDQFPMPAPAQLTPTTQLRTPNRAQFGDPLPFAARGVTPANGSAEHAGAAEERQVEGESAAASAPLSNPIVREGSRLRTSRLLSSPSRVRHTPSSVNNQDAL